MTLSFDRKRHLLSTINNGRNYTKPSLALVFLIIQCSSMEPDVVTEGRKNGIFKMDETKSEMFDRHLYVPKTTNGLDVKKYRDLETELGGEVNDSHKDHDSHEDHDNHEDHDSHDSHEKDDGKPWGSVILFTLLCNLTAFSGVLAFAHLLVQSCCGRFLTSKVVVRRSVEIGVPSFAAGALMATACLLILPEAMNLITHGVNAKEEGGDDHEGHRRRFLEEHEDHEGEGNEQEISLKFGLSLLMGFLLPTFIAFFVPKVEETVASDDDEENAHVDAVVAVELEELGIVEKGEHETVEKVTLKGEEQLQPNKINYKLLSSILIGDGFHNFGDGIFIGIGFMSCSRTIAYSILAATVYHELAQEIADFFLLTRQGGLSVTYALLLNFLSGLTITLGGIVILSLDLEKDTVGIILTVAAGVYVHIAGSECMPRIDAAVYSCMDKLTMVATFALGAVPIGLVLLNHEHCGEH